MARTNPTHLPADWRRGTYVPRDPYSQKIEATVDVAISRREILMHNETEDYPFVISPQELRKKWKRKGD